MKYVLFTKLNVLSKPSISAKTCLSVGQNTVAMGDLVRTVLLGCWDDSYIIFLCVGGPEGLRALTNPKAIMVDRWPALIQTSIPKVLDYPIRSLYQSWCVC